MVALIVSVLFASGERNFALAPLASLGWGLAQHWAMARGGLGAAMICHCARSMGVCTWTLVTQDWVLWSAGS